MNSYYYVMSYEEYLRVLPKLHTAIAHCDDDYPKPGSVMTVKVTGEDYIHHYLEKMGHQQVLGIDPRVIALNQKHPIMRWRG